MKEDSLTFRPDESTKAGVLRIADGLIDAALRRARQPGGEPGEDVHFFRTTTKRLRALLQLIRPAIARTAFEHEDARLKKAARRLAPLRDRAVAHETLKGLGEFAGILRRCGLTDCNVKTRSRRRAMRDAARDLEQSRRGFQRLRIRGEGWEAIGPGLTKTYRQARRRMKAACAHPSDRAFHRWRIRVKQLGYQLQWLEAVWPKRFARMRERLHKLDENLGADHDLVILRELLGKMPGSGEGSDVIKQVKKSAAKRSRRFRRASRPLGAKALAGTPRRFQRKCRWRWRRG